jgi:hypothetical protein
VVADGDAVDTRADLLHQAGTLVPEHDGRRLAEDRGEGEIRGADPRGVQPHGDLTGTGGGEPDVGDVEGAAGGPLHRCAHLVRSCSSGSAPAS